MSRLVWDKTGEKMYETGVEQVALFPMASGTYGAGVAWNGVTALNLTPEGGEPTDLYANNKKWLTLMSTEKLNGTIEAYMYPDEWAACDGSAELSNIPGVTIGQQPRSHFGLVAKTLIGNDTDGNKKGYKLHILYDAVASPTEYNYNTVNEDPEVDPMSWEFTTTPVDVEPGVTTSHICIDSTKFTENNKSKLEALEKYIYGSDEESAEPTFPMPAKIIELLGTAG